MQVLQAPRRVCVVLGACAPAIRATLTDPRIEIVVNNQWRSGQGSSLAAGVRHLTKGGLRPASILVVLADQPRVTAETINRVIGARARTGAPLIATDQGGHPGPPALFTSDFFASLRSLSGDIGARDILRTHSREVLRLPLGQECLDVDTPEHYERLLEQVTSPA